jgi:hypothetical protein
MEQMSLLVILMALGNLNYFFTGLRTLTAQIVHSTKLVQPALYREITSWSEPIPLPGWLGARNRDGGVAITTVDERQLLMYFFLDNPPYGNNPARANRGIYRVITWNPCHLPSLGQFRTDDDADRIEFFIEYDVTSHEIVEFAVELDPSITWFKRILVPVPDWAVDKVETS